MCSRELCCRSVQSWRSYEIVAHGTVDTEVLEKEAARHEVAQRGRCGAAYRYIRCLSVVVDIVAEVGAEREAQVPVLIVERVVPCHGHLGVFAVVIVAVGGSDLSVAVAVHILAFDGVAVDVVNLLIDIEAIGGSAYGVGPYLGPRTRAFNLARPPKRGGVVGPGGFGGFFFFSRKI